MTSVSNTRNEVHSSSDFSFVSNEAKRNFLRSEQSSPTRSKGYSMTGLGPRVKTNLFYDTISLSSSLEFLGSGVSKTEILSDSSRSSISPTSGYSSTDLLDIPSVNLFEKNSITNGNAKYTNDNECPNKSLIGSQPIRYPQPYETGFKPASHRTGGQISQSKNHSCFNSAKNSMNSTSKHSANNYMTKYSPKNNMNLAVSYQSSIMKSSETGLNSMQRNSLSKQYTFDNHFTEVQKVVMLLVHVLSMTTPNVQY